MAHFETTSSRFVQLWDGLFMTMHSHNMSGDRPKERQAAKIRALGKALVAAGFRTLDEQAKVLGLGRGTAWNVVRGRYKASGLSVTTINRMLSAPSLPPSVRAILLEYIEEKAAGLYGDNKRRRRRFAAHLAGRTTEQKRT